MDPSGFWSYPTDESHLNRWLLAIMGCYLAASFISGKIRQRPIAGDTYLMQAIQDAITFGGSITLLWGTFDPNILKIVGSVTPYLFLSGAYLLAVSAINIFRR